MFRDERLKWVSFSKLNLAISAAVFAAVGGYILWQALAAGSPQTYYASPTGGGNTCSQAIPCSFTTALDKALGNDAGDTIDLASVDWPSPLSITGKNYGEPGVTITGSSTSKIQAGLTISDSDNITLSGFTVEPIGGGSNPDSILKLDGDSSSITIDGLKVNGAPENWPLSGGAPPMDQWQPDPADGNKLKPLGTLTGKKAQIFIDKLVAGVTIKNSQLSNCVATCIETGYDDTTLEMPDDLIIIKNIFSSDNFPGIKNLFIGRAGNNVHIDGNRFDLLYNFPDGDQWGNGGGVCDEIFPPGDGNGCAHQDPHHIIVSSGGPWTITGNWFGNSEESGAQVKVWKTNDFGNGRPHDVTFASNLFRSSRSGASGIGLEGSGRNDPDKWPLNIHATNNTLFTTDSGIGVSSSWVEDGVPVGMGTGHRPPSIPKPRLANNISKIIGVTTCERSDMYSNLAITIKGTGCDTGVVQGDPLLDPNYGPTPASLLVIDLADPAYAPATDYYGHSRQGLADRGAIEYLGPDDQPPTVSIIAPANGSTVKGTIAVTANAADNVDVVGVQFKLDGNNLGFEDIVGPYSVSWDTTTASNGPHALSAVARDAAGHSTTSATINVTVDNTAPPAPPPPPPSQQFPQGDLNKDHQVDVLDLSILLSDYGSSDPISDLDGKGSVDVIDLSILLSHYGQ